MTGKEVKATQEGVSIGSTMSGIGQTSTRLMTLEELHKALDETLGSMEGHVAVVTKVRYGDYKCGPIQQTITLAGRIKV